MAKQPRMTRLAWGESADVFLLPKKRSMLGARVVRIEKRFRGMPWVWEITPNWGLVHYYRMKLANLLFPEHIISMRGVVTHKKTARGLQPTYPQWYSKYYALPQKARREIQGIQKRIQASHQGKAAFKEVKADVAAFDKSMRQRYPAIIETAKRMGEAGLVVPHPELNFTVHNGRIVFFEVELKPGSARFDKIFETVLLRAKSIPRENAKKLFLQVLRLVCEIELAESQKNISGNTSTKLGICLGDFLELGVFNKKETERIAMAVNMLYLAQRARETARAFRLLRIK